MGRVLLLKSDPFAAHDARILPTVCQMYQRLVRSLNCKFCEFQTKFESPL